MKLFLGLVIIAAAFAAPPTQLERRVAAVRETIASGKATAGSYNELAGVLVRRARETGDPQYCDEAQRAAEDSLRMARGAFEGRKSQVAVWLCKHRWSDALEEAERLHKQVPDDVPVWGYIADAQMAMGNYDEAEKAAQWMIDLRRANPQGLERGAELRQRFGFNDPALEWWTSAMHLTSATDVEERAWILTRVAHLNRVLGRYDAAESAGKQALLLEPEYPWALEELASVAMARKDFATAIALLKNRERAIPSVAARYSLGAALLGAGRTADARDEFANFEKQAVTMIGAPRNANRELIYYYIGPGNNAAEALRIAELTRRQTHDEDTLEAYAVALAARGSWKSAAEQMALALKPGLKDPEWFMTAGKIARQSGDRDGARRYFQQALEAAPGSPFAGEAILELSKQM